jgi:hypothetical protein
MEILGCLETAVNINLRCVKLQKNEDLLYKTTEPEVKHFDALFRISASGPSLGTETLFS